MGGILEKAFAMAGDAIVVTRDGIVEDVNPAFARLAGRAREACIGRPISELRVAGDRAAILRDDGTRVPVQLESAEVEGRILEVLRDRSEAQARAQAIAELATDYHYAADVAEDGAVSIRWISDSYTRITGWTLDDIRAHRMGLDFIVPEDLPLLYAKNQRAGEGAPVVGDYRILTRSGEIRWVRDFTVHVRDERGRVVAMTGAAKDITEEKMAEQRLRESEARYRVIAESSNDVITSLDANGIITYVSPSVRRVLGYEPEELIGTSGLEHSHPDERPERDSMFAAVTSLSTDPIPLIVTRLRHKDGRYRYLESSTRIVCDEHGQFVAMQSISRDVTERVEAEQALARAERRFRELLHVLPDPVAVHSAGRVVFANGAFVSLLGYDSADEIVGRDGTDLVHPDDRGAVASVVASDVRPKREGELRLSRRDGNTVLIELRSIPMFFEGKLVRIVFAHDCGERKRIEAELAVSERLASLGRLASAVGHEINNPLTYVLHALELLDRDLETARPHGESLRARVSLAREGAERVRDIVRDLRSLSADDSANPEEGCDLRRVLDVAAATAAHEIRHRARLVRENGDLPNVAGSEGRLVQVFVNLLVNAAQSIPDGNVDDNEIRITTRRAGESIVVEVHDTGTGISSSDAQHIFEPFFTTKPAGVGTGLGLAIVQRIVASVGGTIGAEPRAPRGSTFRVTLPVRAPKPCAVCVAAPARTEARARVLLVDDEPMIRRLAAKLLVPHDVVTVGSGREAIDLLRNGDSFDAIVCDLQMKDLGGADVYDWLVTSRPELERRLAFMTGGAFTDRASKLVHDTRRPCLEKPFDSGALRDLVDRLLQSD